MQKLIFLFLWVPLLHSCTKECVEDPGIEIEKEITAPAFTKLIVNHGVEVFITDGNTPKIWVKTGENKLDNVFFEVNNSILEIKADSPCMFAPNYESIKVYITSPLLTSIRNSGEFTIHSLGVLHYPVLELLVEDFNSNYSSIGDIDLEVDNQQVRVTSNGFGNITLRGKTDYLNLFYAAGVGKFEGKNLISREIIFFHRGENNLSVFPVQSLRGDLYSVGNLLSYNHPTLENVNQYFSGKLIYE